MSNCFQRMFLMWSRLRAQRSRIQFWPSALFLVHRHSSWFSESFNDVLLMVGSSKSLHFYSEEHFSEIVPQFFADWWTSANLYIWEDLPLWNALFISSQVIDLLTIEPIRCQMILQLFFIWSKYFSSLFFFFYLFQLFQDALLLSKSKWANIFHEMVKCQYQHLISPSCSTGNKYGFMSFKKFFNKFFFYLRFTQRPNFFWNWNCNND